jgi:hypothetical protein
MAGGFDPDAYLASKKQPSGGFDPDAYLKSKGGQESGGILEALQKFGQQVDSYTGAPTRAAVSKIMDGEISSAPGAFADAFGEDPAKGPSAKDLALKAGVSDNKANLEDAANSFTSGKGTALRGLLGMVPGAQAFAPGFGKALDDKGVTNADIAAVPIDFATDWTNAVGALPVKKGLQAVTKAMGLSDLIKAPRIVDKLADTVKVGESVGDAVKVADGALPPAAAMELAYEGGRKFNADDVAKAAKRLGFEPTPGMLSESPTLKGLESSLDQSPSLGGLSVRSGKSGTNQLRKGLEDAVERFGLDSSAMSKLESGDVVKSDILENVSQRYKPISEKFDEIRKSTEFIEVPAKIKEIAANRFLRQKDVMLSPDSSWGTKALRYASDMSNVKNVDDIKRLRTLALGEARNATDVNDRRVLGYIAGQLEALEGATIKRAASLAGANPKEGAKIGRKLVKDLRGTRKEFREFIDPLRQVSKNAGLKNPRTVEEFVDAISELPAEQIGDKLFKTNNVKALGLLKEKFPTSFDTIRTQKISDIVEKSSVKGKVNASRLIKNLKAMGPEARELVFNSKDVNENLNALETVINALPDKIGPSGTPQGEMFLNLVKPLFQAQEGGRALTYKTLQNPKLSIDAVKQSQTLKFPMKKAGQATVGGLADLLEQIQQGTFKVNAGRTLQNATSKERK